MSSLRIHSSCRPPAAFLSSRIDGISIRSLITPQIHATFYALTDRGRTRDHNEDTFLVADLGAGPAVRESRSQDLTLGERGALYLVADGMGGAAAGEVASEMAATEIHRYLIDTWRSDKQISIEEKFASRLRESVEAGPTSRSITTPANIPKCAAWGRPPRWPRSGTTACTVACRSVICARLPGAQRRSAPAHPRSIAHPAARRRRRTHRRRSRGERTVATIILQALGPDVLVKVDLSRQSLQQNDVLIICSDGLSNVRAPRRHRAAP